MSFYTKKLKVGEELVLVLRRHWIINLPRYILAAVLTLVPFFLMWPLFVWGLQGQIIFCFLLALAVFYWFKTLAFNYYSCLVVTTQRLIDFMQLDILARRIKTVELFEVREVDQRVRNIIHRIFHLADLEIKLATDAGERTMLIEHVSQPERLQSLILEISRLSGEEKVLIERRQSITGQYQDILSRIKKEVGLNEFRYLVNKIESDKDDVDEENSAVINEEE